MKNYSLSRTARILKEKIMSRTTETLYKVLDKTKDINEKLDKLKKDIAESEKAFEDLKKENEELKKENDQLRKACKAWANRKTNYDWMKDIR